MTEDLTKLTVKELTCQPHITSDLWSEILRRLERMEQAQYVEQKALEHAVRLEERLEKCETAIDAARDVVQCMHGDDELPRADREVLQRLLNALDAIDAARAAVEGK